MLRTLILKRLDAEERKLGGSLDYMRQIVRTSLPAFFKFGLFMPFAAHRRALPVDACNVARLVGSLSADCGTCVQIGVNMALAEGVNAAIVRAVVERRPEDLPRELAEVYRFAWGVAEASGAEEGLRDALRARWGDAGLIEIGYALASARVFPTVKRAMGFATSCALVKIRVP